MAEKKNSKGKKNRVGGKCGCAGCMGLLFLLFLVVLIVVGGHSDTPASYEVSPPQAPQHVPDPTIPLERFCGEFESVAGSAKYELSLNEFRLFTKVDEGMHLHTRISQFQLDHVPGLPDVVEFTGRDEQAGAMPETTIRISLQANGFYDLVRVRPLGGRVGLFGRLSP